MTGIIIIIIASFIDGFLEGFGFDGRMFFENRFNVNPLGFWGSQSWKKRYDNPSLYNKFFGVFDFYHTADDLRKYGYIGGAFLIGFFSEWVCMAVAIVLSILSKRLGMQIVRKKIITKS